MGLAAAGWGPNPASSRQRGVFFGAMREYSIPELTSGVAVAALPAASVLIRQMAFAGYRETAASVASSFALKRMRLGLRVRLESTRPEGFRSSQSVSLAFGLIGNLGKGSVGLLVARRSMGIGYAVSAGGWTVMPDLLVTEGIFSPRLGWVFRLSPALTILGGLASSPDILALGLTIGVRGWRAEFGFSRHEPLGWSQAVGLRWQ
ncbi:MAG: hypothetical protein ACI9BV_000964 [Rhodothermales bacterium]